MTGRCSTAPKDVTALTPDVPDDPTMMRKTLRILHVSEVIKGGICTYLRELVSLQRQAFGTNCITVLVPKSQRAELPVPPGVALLTFDDQRSRVISALRLGRAVLRLVAELKPNIVHIHSTFAGAVLRPMLALSDCRATVIYCPHGWAFDRDNVPLTRYGVKWLERLLSRWCDAIVCVSGHERTAAIKSGIKEDKLFLVRNGLPRLAPEPEPVSIHWPVGSFRVLFVGRLDRQKGVDILFDALRGLGDDVFAIIAGDSLRSMPGTLPANACYAGWLTPSQLETYYRDADVVVMPSRWEGFPLVAVEAMRAGIPIIASRVGGLPEIIENGTTGLLINPNDKDALIAALLEIKGRPLRTMRLAAREHFLLKLTIDDTHRSLCKLYRQLVEVSHIDDGLHKSATE